MTWKQTVTLDCRRYVRVTEVIDNRRTFCAEVAADMTLDAATDAYASSADYDWDTLCRGELVVDGEIVEGQNFVCEVTA